MNKFDNDRIINYGMFSPKIENSRHLRLNKDKKNFGNYSTYSKYTNAVLGTPINLYSNSNLKNKNKLFSPNYSRDSRALSPIHHSDNNKLRKSLSQRNFTSRALTRTSRGLPTVNNHSFIKSPINKRNTNKKIKYTNLNEHFGSKQNFFNLETEKLYQETRQTKKLVRFLTKELLTLKKENEMKDKQITIKEKEINDIIVKNNSLLLGQVNMENNEINNAKKINEYSTNNSYMTNNTNNNKTEDSSNIFNDSIYLNALSCNRNSSTGNLFFKIKKEIKKTNINMKLENDKFEKLKKSMFLTKMNELNIESNLLKEQIKKINSLLDNALVIKKNNDAKNNEMIKIKENLEKQEKIEDNLTTMIKKLEKEEYFLKMKLEINELELRNKIKEVNVNINKLVILKKKNENLNKDKVIKNEIYINKNSGNITQINSVYRNKIKELKKSIKFYERQLKQSDDELIKLKEKRKKLIETEKIKGLTINLDINNKEKEEITIIKKDKKEEEKVIRETEEEKIIKLKEQLRKAKESEKIMEEKLVKYMNKLKELEIIEEEKEKEESQSQIEFGIDQENPFYTEEEGNSPEISLKFTSSQFNQFTYVLFKNFEAKGIVEDESKNRIINIFNDYMQKNNIHNVEYNSDKFKEVMEEFTKIIINSLNSNNAYNYTLTNIFISALFYNSECNIKKLIKYFNILFSYTKNYSIEEEKYLNKLRTKYNEQIKKLINCVKNYIESDQSDNKVYFPLLKMKEILDKNEINLKDKYVEFLFYYLKKFDDPDTKLSDLKYDLLKNIVPEEEKKDIDLENSENNNLNFPIKDSEIKDNSYNKNIENFGINLSKKEEKEEKEEKEDSNILDLIERKSIRNLTEKKEKKSPTEEDFSKRQKKKKKSPEKKSHKKEKKEEKDNSDDFEEDEDSMTEITNEEYVKQLTEALKIMQKGLKEKDITFEELMINVVQKRKITGIFYECISVEDFNEQFKSINIVLSDLKLSCLCSKYSIPNELRLIDKNKIGKDIEKQAKGILKFSEDDEEEEDDNYN